MPFRQAHHVTGAAVRMAEERGCDISELDLEALQGLEPGITKAVYEVLGVDSSVASRTSFGGTAPVNVRAQVLAARTRFL
jgi:argininosuccinate lyase